MSVALSELGYYAIEQSVLLRARMPFEYRRFVCDLLRSSSFGRLMIITFVFATCDLHLRDFDGASWFIETRWSCEQRALRRDLYESRD